MFFDRLLKRKWLTSLDKEECLRKRLFRAGDIATRFVLDKEFTSKQFVASTILEQSLVHRIGGGAREPIARISQCHCEKTPSVFQLCPLAVTVALIVSSGVSTIDSQSERKSHSNVSVNLPLLLHYYISLWI